MSGKVELDVEMLLCWMACCWTGLPVGLTTPPKHKYERNSYIFKIYIIIHTF